MMAHTNKSLEDNVSLQTSFAQGADKRESAGKDMSWGVAHFVEAINKRAPNLNWKVVMQSLDYPGFKISDLGGLAVIVAAYHKGSTVSCSRNLHHLTRDQAQFPIDALLTPWDNKEGQLSILTLLVDPNNSSDPNVSALLALPMRRVPRDGVKNINDRDPHTIPWLSLDLIRALVHVSVGAHYEKVRSLFLDGIRACPELVAIGLAGVEPSWTPLHEELLLKHIFPLFFSNQTNSSVVFMQMWKLRAGLILHGAEYWYTSEPSDSRLDRILDLTHSAIPVVTCVASTCPSHMLRCCLSSWNPTTWTSL